MIAVVLRAARAAVLLGVMLLAVAAAPPAHAQLGLLGETEAPTVPEPEGLEGELAVFRGELHARRQTIEGQARWAIGRAESRRAALLEEERVFSATLQGRRRVPADQLERERQILTLYREADQLASDSIEQWDRQVSGLLEATARVRELELEQRTPLPSDPGRAALQLRQDRVRETLDAATARQEELRDQREALEAALEAARADLARRREELLAKRLAAVTALPELTPTDEGPAAAAPAPADGEAPAADAEPSTPAPPPAPEPLDEAELAARAQAQRLARVALLVGERRVEQTRLQIDEVALEQELAAITLRVLRDRSDQLGEEIDSAAAFEEGGLLSRGSSPLGGEAWNGMLDRLVVISSHPGEATMQLQRELRGGSGELRGGTALALVLVLVLSVVIAARWRRRLAAEPRAEVAARVFVGGLRGVLLVGPLCLLPLTALVLGLSVEEATPLLWFLAAAPAFVAGVLGATGPLRAGSPPDLSQNAAGALLRLVRVALGAGIGIGLLAETAPLVGFPSSTRPLLETLLGGVWLLLWLGAVPRRANALRMVEIALSTRLPTVLRDGLLRLYPLFAFVPLTVWILYVAGMGNLAGFLLEGGVVTTLVLLVTPAAWNLISRGAGRLSGFPDGGGPLSLSPTRAASVHRTVIPVLMVATFGVAALVIASGWGYGGLLETAHSMVGASLLQIGGSEISIGRLLLFALTVGATLLIVRWLIEVLHAHLYPLYDLDRGMHATIDTLVRYVVVGLGIVVGLDVVGVGVGVLTVFAGVVGIGVGFGSQTLAANFISGLILLIARPVAVGDTIEVSGTTGKVVRISSYATVLETLDRLTVIVPNSAVINESVINWSIYDRRVRLAMSVGVAYGSDTALVERLLREAAESVDGILDSPAPEIRFEDFADSALVFTLLHWSNTPEDRMRIASRLRFKVDALFRANGVEISFPQMDIHVRPGDGVVQLQSIAS